MIAELLSKFGGARSERPLTVLERSDVMNISGQIVKTVNALLSDNDEASRTNSKGNRFMLTGKDKLRNHGNFSNADFSITTYGKEGSTKVYFFYRYGVDRFMVEKNRTGNQHLTNKRDVRPGELKKLFEDIKDCLPH